MTSTDRTQQVTRLLAEIVQLVANEQPIIDVRTEGSVHTFVVIVPDAAAGRAIGTRRQVERALRVLAARMYPHDERVLLHVRTTGVCVEQPTVLSATRIE